MDVAERKEGQEDRQAEHQAGDRLEPGHPLQHRMTSAVPTETCTRCHYGDASIGLAFRGMAQLVPGMPAGPDVEGTTDELKNGTFYIQDQDLTPPDVHHQRAGLHPVRLDHFRTAHCRDQNIRLTNDRGQVFSTAVADGHGRILMQQKHGRRQSDNIAAAHHHHVFAFQVDVVVINQRHDALRRGAAVNVFTHGHHSESQTGHAVHVFLQGDMFDAIMNYRWFRPARHFFAAAPDPARMLELGEAGIRVNAVAPGIIGTEPVLERITEHIEDYRRTIPLGRIGKPDDVAFAVLYLASDESSFVTGETINASGGWYMRP